MSLRSVLFEYANSRGASDAILAPDRKPLTFASLAKRTEEIKDQLNSLGIGCGDRVVAVLPNGPETAVCYLAVAQCATFAPLNPALKQSELEVYLKRLNPRVVIVPKQGGAEIRSACANLGLPILELSYDPALTVGHFTLEGDKVGDCGRPGWNRADDIVLILPTSGTTQRPKLVPHTDSRQLRYGAEMHDWFGIGPEDRSLHFMPMFHGHGLSSSLMCSIICGNSIVCLPRFDIREFFEAISVYAPTWYSAGFSYHRAILEGSSHYRDIASRSRLRFIRSGSGYLDPSIMKGLEDLFGAPVIERYGMTEAHTVAANPLPPGRRKPGTVGLPVHSGIAIRNDEGKILEEGKIGEVVVPKELVFSGYLDDPISNAKAFVDCWFRTGDQGFFDSDGYLTITGRVDDVINRGGEKISPAEVEAIIKEHEAVCDCVCFPMPHQTLGDTVAAAITLQEGQTVQELEIQDFLKNRVSDFKIPNRIIQCDEIPHGQTGKIQRIRLAEHFGLTEGLRQKQDTVVSEPPPQRPALLKTLASLWCDVIRIDDVKDDDNFILLGGDSLRAARLLVDVEEIFGIRLPDDIIYRKGRTLIGMANAITDARKKLLGAQRANSVDKQNQIPKRDTSQPCPLTFSQQRLWFLSKFDTSGDLFNSRVAVKLKGRIDPAVLRQALNVVVARHEALRASFPEIDGVPQQVFAPTLVLDMPITDLRSLQGADQEAELKRLTYAEAAQPFSLDKGPLIRSRLVLMTEQECALLLPQHHLVSDGFSSAILFSELMKCYGDMAKGEPVSLPALPIQFGDYAAWQRQQLQGARLEKLRLYWKSYLDGAPLVLDLPFDRPRPSIQSYRGSRIQIDISKRLVEGLRAVSARAGASLFHGALAAFEVLIHRISGQQDFIMGTAINNRKQGITDAIIGFFVNTLPLRVKFSDDLTFSDHLKAVRQAAVEAQEFSDMPFEQIVEELNPPRDTGCQPVVQLLFGFATRDRRVFEHAGIGFERIDIDLKNSRFDLSVMLSEDRGALEGIVDYRTDLFDRGTVIRFLDMFQRLLEQIIEAPDCQIADLQLVSQAEQKELLEEWSGCTTPYPSDSNIPQLFADIATQYPKAVALIHDQSRITYAELDQWSNRLAHRLIEKGVSRGTVVAISAERTPALVAGLLGILKAGGAYLALDSSLPAHRVGMMLDDAKISVCLVQEGSKIPPALEGVSVIGLADDESDLDDQETTPLTAPISPDGLAYVSFTSGSTGQPKGVCVPHRAVVRLVKNTNYAHFGPDEKFLQLANVAFDASTFEIWGCLLNGGSLVQVPSETPTLFELAALIEDHEITTLWLTAGLFHQMVEHELPCFRNVRQVLAGGDVLSPNHVRRFIQSLPNCRLINGYGPTENTTFTCTYTVPDDGDIGGPVPIGRPIANTQVYILDKKLNPVPVGIEGELFAAGDGLAVGYLNRPELTAERFILNPYDPRPGARMYRTGDRARFLPNGQIEFIGRVDDQVKIRGFRVEPGEVEAVLSEYPLLEQAAVVAKTDARRGTSLIAYMVPRDASNAPLDQDIRNFLAARLPSYMVPSAFVLLEKMPLTKNGKLDREKLQADDRLQRDDSGSPILPRTPVEQILGDIWCDLLRIKEIGVDDDFFQLGGHSLMATQLIHRISRETQENLPLSAVFQNSTIRCLALLITERMLAEAHADGATSLGAS